MPQAKEALLGKASKSPRARYIHHCFNSRGFPFWQLLISLEEGSYVAINIHLGIMDCHGFFSWMKLWIFEEFSAISQATLTFVKRANSFEVFGIELIWKQLSFLFQQCILKNGSQPHLFPSFFRKKNKKATVRENMSLKKFLAVNLSQGKNVASHSLATEEKRGG